MKIIQLICDVNMGLGHPGLTLMMQKRFKIDLAKLSDDKLVMFLNGKKDKLKVIGKQGMVLGYLRMPHSRKIMLEAIQYLPQTFGGAGFNYDAALKKALEARLGGAVSTKKTGPLEAFRTMQGAGLTNARTQKQSGVENGK